MEQWKITKQIRFLISPIQKIDWPGYQCCIVLACLPHYKANNVKLINNANGVK